MADLDDRLAHLDGPRPLPRALRARLEARLAGDTPLAGIDRPRPLPAELRSALEHELVAPAGELRSAPAAAAGAAGPRGLPALAIAAVLLLLIGLAAVTRVDRSSGVDRQDVATGGIGRGARTNPRSLEGATGSANTATGSQATTSDGEGRAPTSSGGSGAGRAATEETAGGAGTDAAVAPSFKLASKSATVAVTRDDVRAYAGFLAYIDAVNAAGEYHIATTEVRPDGRQDPAHLTVNLSPWMLTGPDGPDPSIVTPLLETLAVTEDSLGEGVYSFAPPLERVAHLAADELFPEDAPGSSAVIYHSATNAEDYRDPAIAAIEEALMARRVAVVRAPWSGNPAQLVPADAAFLVLSADAAGEWLRAAEAAGHRPARGVAGLDTLLDEGLIPDIGDHVSVLSPYALPDEESAQLIRTKISALSAGEEPAQLSAAAIHGWVTAHGVVEMLRRIVSGEARDFAEAIDELPGWDSGLFPAYEVRPGTHARTPEATVFRVDGAGFISDGTFRRDPR